MKTRVREIAGVPIDDGKERHWFNVTIDEGPTEVVLWKEGKMLCAEHEGMCVCKQAVIDSHLIPASV